MFESVARTSRWPWVLALGVAAFGAASFAVPDRQERFFLLLAGGNPLATPVATTREDFPYAQDPLGVSLELESAFVEVRQDQALGFADRLARRLGWWLLENTGASDLAAAERVLWERDGGPDALVEAYATLLQEEEVYARTIVPGLWAGVPAEPPRYVHPDELPLLWMHVAAALDLRTELVRSPRHLYVHLREPGGERVRGFEPTCFRLFSRTASADPSGTEPSVGRSLLFPPDHFPSGRGGVPVPDPLPAGTFEPVSGAALASELLAKVAARHDVDLAKLEAKLTDRPEDAPLASLVWRTRLSAGLRAWELGDLPRVRVEAAALRSLRETAGSGLPERRDERVLDAIVALDGGRTADGLAALAEVAGAEGEVGGLATWLELEYGERTAARWDERSARSLAWAGSDPARLARWCALGATVLRDDGTPVTAASPACGAR